MPYVYCWISSCLFAYKASHVKRKSMMFFYSLIAILIPVLLGGLRSIKTGTDIGTYVVPQFMRAIGTSSFSDFSPNGLPLTGEAGWILVTYITAKIFGHINWNLFMYQLINISCVYIGAWRFRKTAPLWLIMLMFFFIEYNHTYNLLRQSIAGAVIFMGVKTFAERKYGRFLLYIIVASWFHTSAVVCFAFIIMLHAFITSPALWRHHKKKKKYIIYSSIVLLAFTRPIMSALVNSLPMLARYSQYTEASEQAVRALGTGWSTLLLNAGEAILFLLYAKGAKKMFAEKWPGGKDMFEYCRYMVFLLIVFRIGVGFFFARLLLYLEYVNILVLASLPGFIKEKHLRVIVLAAVIIACLILWWYVHIYKASGTGSTWPYMSIL